MSGVSAATVVSSKRVPGTDEYDMVKLRLPAWYGGSGGGCRHGCVSTCVSVLQVRPHSVEGRRPAADLLPPLGAESLRPQARCQPPRQRAIRADSRVAVCAQFDVQMKILIKDKQQAVCMRVWLRSWLSVACSFHAVALLWLVVVLQVLGEVVKLLDLWENQALPKVLDCRHGHWPPLTASQVSISQDTVELPLVTFDVFVAPPAFSPNPNPRRPA